MKDTQVIMCGGSNAEITKWCRIYYGGCIINKTNGECVGLRIIIK